MSLISFCNNRHPCQALRIGASVKYFVSATKVEQKLMNQFNEMLCMLEFAGAGVRWTNVLMITSD
jgi:hypothetical protein